MVKNPKINTAKPIPKYSHTTLLFTLPLKTEVVNPSKTYIEDERINGHMVVGVGQKEKARASSPRTRLSIKLWTNIAVDTLSSILRDQRTCKIKGKLIIKTANPFQKNHKLKAYITLNKKKADKSVKRKFAVEAALYKGMVLKDATLKTF